MGERRVHEWRRTLLATLAVVLIVAPFYFVVIYGMMSDIEIHRRPPYMIPPRPTFAYYLEAISVAKSYLKNSFVIAAGVMIMTLVTATPTAFALTKLRLRMAQLVLLLMAFVLMAPMVAVVTPLFLIFYRLRLLNTHLSVILAVSAFSIPFGILVLSAHMKSIPSTLIEAAQIDGASLWRVFWNVVLPLAKPAIATAAVLVFLQGWGNFVFPVAFLQRRELQPMSVGLFIFVGQYGVRWNLLLAASAIYALPPVIAVMVASKRLVAGLMSGALKE